MNSEERNTALNIALDINLPSPMQKIRWPVNSTRNNGPQIFVKRDDLIHPHVSGNKWRKLSPAVAYVTSHGTEHVLSFGGAYSNHLHALAFLCLQLGVRFTAIVRGDYSQSLTSTLEDIKRWGAHIVFVSKLDYKKRINKDYCDLLKERYNADLVIPEGGSHKDTIIGLAPLIRECYQQLPDATHLILPVASGGTLAGVVQALKAQQSALAYQHRQSSLKVIGIGVLKGQGYLEDLVNALLPPIEEKGCDTVVHKNINWHIDHSSHHGGYAKHTPELREFIALFEKASSIQLEPVYSGKCFWAVDKMLKSGQLNDSSKVIVLHTGGLQGK